MYNNLNGFNYGGYGIPNVNVNVNQPNQNQMLEYEKQQRDLMEYQEFQQSEFYKPILELQEEVKQEEINQFNLWKDSLDPNKKLETMQEQIALLTNIVVELTKEGKEYEDE